MDSLIRTWLLLQVGLFGLLAAGFGLVFPLGGLAMGLLGLAPPGEDPWGPALAMICAGPVTALFYLPGCVAAAVASRRLGRDPEQAQVPLLVAAVLAAPLCGVGVALPVLLVVTRGDGDSPA